MYTRRIVRRPPLSPEVDWSPAIPPVLQRVYARRTLNSLDDLDYSLSRLLPFTALSGIDKAVNLLYSALLHQQHIIVVGDFDADGATSTIVAIKALRAMGARNVNYLVPDRFRYGYGLSPEIATIAHERRANLIVTVDNGISSLEGIKRAKELGMFVLVTDHHLAGAVLPEADAIVNPNQNGDRFPSKSLAGVGVIFYVMMALRSHLRSVNWFTENNLQEINLAQLLDIVALGTVADVVPLDSNNRILVEQGLRRIRAGHGCPGITALLEVSGKESARIVASDLGYYVAPRLNAAGRLEDMSIGIECLLSEDIVRARHYAALLNQLNLERKEIEQQMRDQAINLLRTSYFVNPENKRSGLCLFDPEWHQGIIGIVASRIKDRIHQPVIAFARGGDDGQIKGSARSIPGIHIRDVLEKIATLHPGLLTKFGGHAMAAGLTLAEDNFEKFTKCFESLIATELMSAPDSNIVQSDGELKLEELTTSTAEQLRIAGPWGQGFPEPLFDDEFSVIDTKILGRKHLKLLLKHRSGGSHLDAIVFNAIDENSEPTVHAGDRAHIAYRLDINEFRGQRNLQLYVETISKLEVELFDY